MITVKLIERRWLFRSFYVVTPEGDYYVSYFGRGYGYEEIWVNDVVVCHVKSYIWYVPRFEFNIGTLPAVINIRIWSWLTIRSFQLTVNGQRVYFEG